VQRLDVASAIEEALASAQPAADAKGVRLVKVLGSAAIIQGDPGRVQQVVWNVVTNAIKFTPRGGLVQVTLRKVNSHIHIQVSDSGQGIRADLLPHVFQRFRQGDASATRHHGGLGLGLAIVKNLVEMHGGSVEAASEGEGLGSVITVRLPLALAGARPETFGEAPESSPVSYDDLLNGLHVLVLDDEEDARDVVQRLLEDAGAQARTVGTAADALALLEQGFVPDIILSDIGMPDQDGYDFMRQVRGLAGEVGEVPAAALTALARVEDRKRALMAGYQTHLAKPVDPSELVAVVATLTGRTGRPVT
jgi:CheY-like chemotaxis protein